MYDAKLHGSIGEYALNGIRKTLKTVHAAYHDILNTAVLQVCENIKPEVRSLAFSDIHAKQFLVPFLGDTQHIVYGTGDGTPCFVLNLVMNGIKPADCINRI